MLPFKRLWIAYDPGCGLCTSVKAWIERQVPLVPLEFVAAGSIEARKRFPQLPEGELAAIGDTGEVWLGNSAWIICLWALRDFRAWSLRLSSPLLKMMAREAFSVISSNRAGLSAMLRLRSDLELEQQFRKVMIPGCEIQRKPEEV
jgi:predicted DCC family thiol-disulfide oxidoreductase YuxK